MPKLYNWENDDPFDQQKIEHLEVCPACASNFVYPVTWEPLEIPHDSIVGELDLFFNMVLRCPECEYWREGMWDERTCLTFDDFLNDGDNQLAKDHDAMVRSNMENEIRVFIAALKVDALKPEDF